MQPILRRGTALATITVVAALPFLARTCDPPARDHGHDYAAAIAAAAADGRAVIVHLRHPERDAGAQLDRATVSDAAVQALLAERFHQVVVDVLHDPAVAARLAGPGAAVATLALDDRERLLARLDGYVEAEQLAAWLSRVDTERPRLATLTRRLEQAPDDAPARLELAIRLDALGAEPRIDVELAALRATLAIAAPEELHATRGAARDFEASRLDRRGQVEAARVLRQLPAERYPPPPSAAAVDVERRGPPR